MAFTSTREQRADRWRTLRVLLAATVTASFVPMLHVAGPAEAQVKAPRKNQIRAAKQASPSDNQADQLNEKWLSEFNKTEKLQADKASAEKPKLAPNATEADDERVSSVPSMAATPGAGARTVVRGSVKMVSARDPAQVLASVGGKVSAASMKDLSQAFAGFTASSAKVRAEMAEGTTADGRSRVLFASVGEGKSKQNFWWFAPPDQPEGWFDEHGKRLGGTVLTEPKPDSRVSSPFGTRRYYGRSRGAGFHNGIDLEGKVGEPIYAAADGVVSHQGWYFNYGRTVKISHADNFETLYAHMSRFAEGVGPGSTVRRGELIGYVGSTGRSTGPHLHFSTIVNGEFVDPMPYMSAFGNGHLNAGALVAYRKWQQDIRAAAGGRNGRSERDQYPNLHGGEWSQNPWSSGNPDRRI